MGEARPQKKQSARVLAAPEKPATPRRKRTPKNAPTDLDMAAAALEAIDAQPAPSICISIPGSAEYVRVVRLALLGVASRMPFSYDDVEDIKLAVAEACNNAIVHSRDGNAAVTVMLTPYTDRLEIEVTDSGRVPPPGLVAPRKTAATQDEELPESGLGMFLMQTLMDKVEHSSGVDADTKVHLVKYLPGNPHRKSAV
jgi:serine/threonine-protein kinase RsbW